MATPSGSKAPIAFGDPARKYGTQDPKARNNITCNFCGKVCKAGIYRLKQHLVEGFKNVSDFPKCLSHVHCEEVDVSNVAQRKKASVKGPWTCSSHKEGRRQVKVQDNKP
ncbi:hypothetical protein E3N88_39921 [Mikania micrantha]|uniref:BED-type domain-containing protein n=1 Tax=Mikania micrantha TaxID=192012 RepID=A0A5N6LL76_9ASTR|nr:hypothetical protein E3N88_39921 [Mikania micrantha]